MLKTLSIFLFFLPCLAAAEDLDPVWESVASPNGLFEIYRLPDNMAENVNGKVVGYGTKLFLRKRGDSGQGILLRENGRWMGALWSPDSGLFAIEDYWDSHSSRIFVFKVALSTKGRVSSRLVFRSPENAYGLRWLIEGWEPGNDLLHLRMVQEVPASWKNHKPVEYLTFKIQS